MPFSLQRGLLVLCAALSCLTASAQSLDTASAERDSPYRLSGIITLNQDRRMALVELPDGGFSMLREGDSFDGGEVVEIAAEWLRIRDDAGEHRIWLTSSGFRAQAVGAGKEGVVLSAGETGQVLQRTLDGEKAVSEMGALLDRKSDKPARLDDLLGPLLGLPREAEIVAINHAPLGSVKESMDIIRKTLAKGDVVRLNIEGYVGKNMVYLMPDQSLASEKGQ